VEMNRSAPWARIVPVIRVGDVRAAVDWYSSVLGLVEHVRIGQVIGRSWGCLGFRPS
jgi:catechol 2,3-dioxygenase-like lactoylglutathione lyase family enzyme